MKPLTENLYYLFRSGMVLRNKHLKEIFGHTLLAELHPDLIQTTSQYLYAGTPDLKDQVTEVPYNTMQLKMGAPDLYQMLLDDQPLITRDINALPKTIVGGTQATQALLSGYLKHDTRGYYPDPIGLVTLQLPQQEVL